MDSVRQPITKTQNRAGTGRGGNMANCDESGTALFSGVRRDGSWMRRFLFRNQAVADTGEPGRTRNYECLFDVVRRKRNGIFATATSSFLIFCQTVTFADQERTGAGRAGSRVTGFPGKLGEGTTRAQVVKIIRFHNSPLLAPVIQEISS
jgi:hypothetical protein